MNSAETHHLSKTFGKTTALSDVSVAFPRGSVIGLIGLNGSGKTTLLKVLTGMLLPSEGRAETLGKAVADLGSDQLTKIGVVHQESNLMGWLKAADHLKYVASFYPQWDLELQKRLVDALDLDTDKKVGALSPGNRQKLAVVLAVCHRPELLLMDEPASAMDPISRRNFLNVLFDLIGAYVQTVVISSHVLTDIEKTVDRIVCLHQGRVQVACELDQLLEQYWRWQLVSPAGDLPERFNEPYVLAQEGGKQHRLLYVKADALDRDAFQSRHGLKVQTEALNLEQIFPLLLQQEPHS